MVEIALMVVAALIIGYSKTALGGLAVISVAIFATIMPAKESTAAILAVLMVGDLIACWHYRRDADWSLIRRLLPAVLPGLVLGTLFLRVVDDTVLKRSIGGVLLVLVLLQLWLKTRGNGAATTATHERRAAAWGAGTAAGFATMTANAAGAVMTLYLSASGIDKRRFVGTNAWFFLIVNATKVPFSVGLGLFSPGLLLIDLALVPFVVLGALAGRLIVNRISRRAFEWTVIVLSVLGAVYLLLR